MNLAYNLLCFTEGRYRQLGDWKVYLLVVVVGVTWRDHVSSLEVARWCGVRELFEEVEVVWACDDEDG